MNTPATPFQIDYGTEIEREIADLCAQIARFPIIAEQYPARWLAINLLAQDHELQQKLLKIEGGAPVLTLANFANGRLQTELGTDTDIAVADHRYTWIHNLVDEAVERPPTDALTRSDKIDRIITDRWLGIPIFLALMWMVFKLTADVSAPYLDWIDGVISGPLSNWTIGLLTAVGLGGSWIESLFVDGIIAGVGGVLVFVPVLISLYLALAVLENSGYMARAAFVMDSAMSKIGLHGKSFLPLMVGFGCSVPAIYATRTLENEKDRILTGLLVPFMSCGARLPVYVLFAAVFFPKRGGLVIFGLYLLGIITAVVLGIILRKTLFFDNETAAFVMELPPYRLPTLKGLWMQTWHRTRAFLKSAWTLILVVSVIIWLFASIPMSGKGHFAAVPIEDSAFAAVAGIIAPVMQPLGFGSWEASSALVSGFVAKEVVVSTMTQVYGVDNPDVAEPTPFWEDVGFIATSFVQATMDTLRTIPLMFGIDLRPDDAAPEQSNLMAAIQAGFEETSGGRGQLAALAFMVFVLIYTPCMVAVAAAKQEFGAKWMWVSVIGQFVLAWLFAFVIFQGGKLLFG